MPDRASAQRDEAIEQRRNAASHSDYGVNLAAARFTPPAPPALALRSQPEATRQIYLVREGLIPRAGFFNGDNLQHILAAGQLA